VILIYFLCICILSVLFIPIYVVFSERELRTHVHVRYILSPVRLSVCRLSSVTFVHSTSPVEIFGAGGALKMEDQKMQDLKMHFHGVTFGPAFSVPPFSSLSSILVPHFQVLYFSRPIFGNISTPFGTLAIR